ncbi:hypothetical protein ACOME3_003541 [Neoechinorhynchus agilis]
MEIVHEGSMSKWTNYLKGWKLRYFILDQDGVLSYFLSEKEVSAGCRGCVKIVACNIIVSHRDELRFDLSIPGGPQLCLTCCRLFLLEGSLEADSIADQ